MTQFIPGAVPPKLKVDGTTGAVNLYPPCFSIILDSGNERQTTELKVQTPKLFPEGLLLIYHTADTRCPPKGRLF